MFQNLGLIIRCHVANDGHVITAWRDTLTSKDVHVLAQGSAFYQAGTVL